MQYIRNAEYDNI